MPFSIVYIHTHMHTYMHTYIHTYIQLTNHPTPHPPTYFYLDHRTGRLFQDRVRALREEYNDRGSSSGVQGGAIVRDLVRLLCDSFEYVLCILCTHMFYTPIHTLYTISPIHAIYKIINSLILPYLPFFIQILSNPREA